ncbi:hypothetical protein QM797_00895 [Rhodococcus sp. IEGM 1381]|uniref:hypothetical protein n=1 Tax=Rhodococcus sp. IEGM 1381 TaxID=3047085 RepID=UPI0024B704BF|nr:hypothetical protein [Rhodococcus sp. IEGM 1381]MDI9893269.1 hypothetical protein [Rhodococcus sp. IEGM 1381]
MPDAVRNTWERVYPYSWLGVLAEIDAWSDDRIWDVLGTRLGHGHGHGHGQGECHGTGGELCRTADRALTHFAAELEVMDGICPESIHNFEFGGHRGIDPVVRYP